MDAGGDAEWVERDTEARNMRWIQWRKMEIQGMKNWSSGEVVGGIKWQERGTGRRSLLPAVSFACGFHCLLLVIALEKKGRTSRAAKERKEHSSHGKSGPH